MSLPEKVFSGYANGSMDIQETVDQADAPGSGFVHWADGVADRIIQQKTNPDGTPKEQYTCASGITPSGTVHIGNFREIISVDLVARALRERGKKVRFIYSWDDYDVFRKVPKNMPEQEMLAAHLRWPIVLVPDPWGQQESYARHHEVAVEKILPSVGIKPEYLYQAKKYRASEYAKEIRVALEKKDAIKAILNEFRTEVLEEDWWPVSVFSGETNRDNTTVTGWDGEWGLTYRDDSTGKSETVDLRKTALVKLPWRIDWPMRWSREGVDFEPAGKDHHSQGGSWSTAEKVCRAIFNIEAPVTFQYDFLSIKGRGGKISSSSGDVIDLYDVQEVYTPELTRFMFAGTRPNTEFSISFDLDVIKIYEDYDRTERIYYGAETVDATHAETVAKTVAKEKRIYELSQVNEVPYGALPFMPLQIPFRALCNYLLIHTGDVEKALQSAPGWAEATARGELDATTPAGADNLRRLHERAACAWKWVQDFAPEDMKFHLRTADEPAIEGFSDQEIAALRDLKAFVEGKPGTWGEGKALLDRADKEVQDATYKIATSHDVQPKAFFTAGYKILVGKSQGPRIGGFLKTLGAEHLSAMLSKY